MTDTAVLDPVLDPAPTPPSLWRRYWRAWRRVPRELLYLFLGLPIASLGYAITSGLLTSRDSTFATLLVGAVLLVPALYLSRYFGLFELIRLGWAGRPRIERPDWQDSTARTGFVGWLKALFSNGHYWLYLLHTAVIAPIVALVTWTITFLWFVVIIGGLGLPLWAWLAMRAARRFPALGDWVGSVTDALPGSVIQAIDPVAVVVVAAIVAILFLATLPLITHPFVLLHDVIARNILGPFKSDALRREVDTLEESRGAAISAEGHSLRRLERDIHDGPQQRLVRMQLDLAAADRKLDTDPAAARDLLAGAMEQAKEALEELRALSRGFAPPILLDRGLVAALQSAAVRNPIPTTVASSLPDGLELPQELERNVYFVASEALANAAKHSGATAIDVSVALRRESDSELWLDLEVRDDGNGGAVSIAGHGLQGLEERLRGLGGVLEVTSPAGGPTVVVARVPVPASIAASPGSAEG